MSYAARYVTPDLPPDILDCRAVIVPGDQSWLACMMGALWDLCDPDHWEQVGGVSPDLAARVFQSIFYAIDERRCVMFAGAIVPAARSTSPGDNWLLCDGAAYLIDQYPALYNAIGDAFGDDGSGTFRVPDLQGRFPLGVSAGHVLASSGGEEEHTLVWDEMPAHYHGIDNQGLGAAGGSGGGQFYKLVVGAQNVTTSAGSDQPHNNMPPFLALSFFIFAGGA